MVDHNVEVMEDKVDTMVVVVVSNPGVDSEAVEVSEVDIRAKWATVAIEEDIVVVIIKPEAMVAVVLDLLKETMTVLSLSEISETLINAL